MPKVISAFFILILCFQTGCMRDLSSNVYTSDSTLSLTLEGKVVSARPIKIKENDKLADNTGGMTAGALTGAAAGANIGKGSGKAAAVIGGVVVGALAGALVESSLGEQDGFEYIVKLDTSKLKDSYYEGSGAMRGAISSAITSGLVTIVQGNDVVLSEGQEIYTIFSDKRVRVIAKN